MKQFTPEAKPYFLQNKIQNYAWGTKNENAFIPDFLGIETEAELPYAELWIGTHPKAPSDIIDGEDKFNLGEIINQYPNEILGIKVAEVFNNKLPFLLKVLSANTALSIQAHPDKELAGVLHKKDPEHYPDDNHKPEIAIALDSLKAIVGFKSFPEFVIVFKNYPELLELISNANTIKNLARPHDDHPAIIKDVYTQIMTADEEALTQVIGKLRFRFEGKTDLSVSEKEFLVQYENYGSDVGLISILLFNYLQLTEGEAFFTDAGIPHAYIKGNIIECMANSDNVVRAGLTPKFKDVNTLIDMLDYSKGKPEIMQNNNVVDVFETTATEFELTSLFVNGKIEFENKSVKVLLCTEGKVIINYSGKSFEMKKGESVLMPAILGCYTFEGENSKIIEASVPV